MTSMHRNSGLTLSARVIQFPGTRQNAAMVAAEAAVRESARLFAYHKAREFCAFSAHIPGSVQRLRKLWMTYRYKQHCGDKFAIRAERYWILVEILRLKRDRALVSKDSRFAMGDMVSTAWGPGRIVGIVWQDRYCDTPHYRYSVELADGERRQIPEAHLSPILAQLAAE